MGGDDGPYMSSLDIHCREEEEALRNGNKYLSRAEFEIKIKEAITLPVEETEEGVGYRTQMASLESNRQLGVDPHNKFRDLLVRSTFNILQWPLIFVGEDKIMAAARGRSLFRPGVPGSMNPFSAHQICLEVFVVSPKL